MEAGVSYVSFSLPGVYCDSRRCCTPLLINGLVVTGTTDLNVPLLQDMCEAWLSERPEVKDFIGCAIRMSWLERLNSIVAADAN